jgi:hypothetical protein
MKGATRLLSSILAVVFFIMAANGSFAQTAVSGMTGEVTDSSGAAVVGATVVLTNKSTGLKYTQATNSSGSYRFTQIPPGAGYEVVFTANGFAPVDVKDIYLTVAQVRTQNASLSVGANVAVEVNASSSEVTIDTTDATIGNAIDVKQLDELPVQQRNNPYALFNLQAGVDGQIGSVTGARTDQNNVTLDGLDVNDFANGGSVQNNSGVSSGWVIVGNAPIDSVEQFHGGVAGLGATTNQGGGGQFQLITKSGTNHFHGLLYEYHRDPSLVANTWFNNASTPQVPRNHLIQNQFGGNIGGPVLHDKLFFFFDYNNSRIISFKTAERAVPLDSFRNGIVTYLDSNGNKQTLTPAQIKALDPAGIGEDATWLAAVNARFPHSNNSADGDGINSGGFAFNAPNTQLETDYVGRGDYNLTQTMKLFARFTITRRNAVNQLNQFNDPTPSNPVVDRSYAFVLGHNWVIGGTKTNRVFLGETVQKLTFANNQAATSALKQLGVDPTSSTFYTFSDGIGQSLADSFYRNPSAQARRVPVPVIGDDFAWTRGNHTIAFGGTFKDILSHSTNVSDYNTVYVGMGGNTLNLCGPAPGACGAGNPSLRPSDIGTATSKPTQQYDQAFAFMLARVGNVRSQYNYDSTGKAFPQLTGDQRFYRYYETEAYLGDSWKLHPNLTVNYGVTYQLFSVPYETRGLQSMETMTFNDYMKARIAQSAASKTGPTAVPLLSYVLAGQANNGPPIYSPEHKDFSPHVGFAWNPASNGKTVLNGSAGIIYDRNLINSVQFLQDVYSYLFQQQNSTALGIAGDPYTSIKTDPRLDSNNQISKVNLLVPPTPKPPYTPFDDPVTCAAYLQGAPCGLQNGNDFNAATIDPALKTPYSIMFNTGLQQELPGHMVFKLNYVGRLGRRLMGQVDANQVLDFPDTVSGELLSTAFGAMTTQLRAANGDYTKLKTQPWMENVYQPGRGVARGFANNTQYLAAALGGEVLNGDFGDFVQSISSRTPQNVGSAAQFSENSFYSNPGFSSYNGMLVTLQKNLSHGLQFDFNYTWAHSIDNFSFFANSQGDTGIGGIGLVCDYIRPRECRADSDFDVRHYINSDVLYELPFGRGKMFLNSSSRLVNETIGGWALSGITTWHTGYPWSDCSNAFVASYSNNAPGIFVGPNPSVLTAGVHKLPGGVVNIFQNNAAAAAGYQGPVGFTIGPRNSLRGPRFFNADIGLAKTFPITAERVNLKFRADAFNALNHPNFALPQENIFNNFDQQDFQNADPTTVGKGFGQISSTIEPNGNVNSGARVLQVALRLEF